ncbi:hypothetical protein Tco_0472723 [Tanacetum coccineum]
MASLDHRLNPPFSIKECMSCGALYTADFYCSKGSLKAKILVPKPPQNCATCGDPVDGLYCRSCAFVRKCLNEGWYTIHDGNTSESSNHNTNVVSAPREPFVFNQDPGINSSQSPPQINHNCCFECGNSLDGIFCQRCICKSCGNGAHIGYNCPPKAPIISNPEPYNQIIDESPQTLPSVHPTCNSGDKNSFTHDSKSNSVNDSHNVFNPPPQPSLNSCEFCGKPLADVSYLYTQVRSFIQERSYGANGIHMCYGWSIMQRKEEEWRFAEDQRLKTILEDFHLYDDDGQPTSDHVKSPSSFSIPVMDSDSFFEESDTSLSQLDNSLPKFETFSDHTEETRSGSTTTHANNSLPEYDSFLFEIEPDQGGLTSIVNSNDPLLEIPEFESFHFDLDPSFPRPPPEPLDVEISLIFEPNAHVINNVDELNEDECFDPGGGEINVEVDDSFTFVTWTFLLLSRVIKI